MVIGFLAKDTSFKTAACHLILVEAKRTTDKMGANDKADAACKRDVSVD